MFTVQWAFKDKWRCECSDLIMEMVFITTGLTVHCGVCVWWGGGGRMSLCTTIKDVLWTYRVPIHVYILLHFSPKWISVLLQSCQTPGSLSWSLVGACWLWWMYPLTTFRQTWNRFIQTLQVHPCSMHMCKNYVFFHISMDWGWFWLTKWYYMYYISLNVHSFKK